MVELAAGDASSLYNCLKETITKRNIPLSNLVGFSADTTNVMFGENHSIFSQLKKELPCIACIKCSCHLIHLASSKACLQLPRSVEDLLRNIGAHFSRSYGRQEKFKEFQIFFHTEIHKILLPSITRWLSLKKCVDRVLEQYSPLQAYFREVCFSDPSKTIEDILNTMNNVFTKIYLEFLSYILDLLCSFNLMFQSETPLLHKLKPEVIKLLKSICSNYMRTSYIRDNDVLTIDHQDSSNFVPLEKIYVGMQAFDSIVNLKQDKNFKKAELETFLTSCLRYYVKLVTEIKQRFIFNDPLFDFISIVDPKNAQRFDIKTLQPVIKRFPFLSKFLDPQRLDNEWKDHALNYESFGIVTTNSAEAYWKSVFDLRNAENEPLFSNLRVVISLLLVLPYSNASVERVFSCLNNIKTKNRNKLKTDTVSAILATKEGVEQEKGCVLFEPTSDMLNSVIWKQNKS